jgi:hypothetical protein
MKMWLTSFAAEIEMKYQKEQDGRCRASSVRRLESADGLGEPEKRTFSG